MYRFTGFADEAADGIEQQVSVLKKMGWDCIELRAVGKQLAHDLPERDFDHVVEILEKNEMTVACLGSGIANWNSPITMPFQETKEMVVRAIERMKALKTNLVRIMSYKVIQDNLRIIAKDQFLGERLRRMNWICQSFLDKGFTPVHENCHTYGGLSYEHTLELLTRVPGLKLVFDTGNPPITVDGRKKYPYPMQDSLEFYSNVKDHVVHVHIKDAFLDTDGVTEHYCFPGEGQGYVQAIVKDLLHRGYSGYFSIEPHMEVVFHNQLAISTEERRVQNFIEYGKRFESIVAEALSS